MNHLDDVDFWSQKYLSMMDDGWMAILNQCVFVFNILFNSVQFNLIVGIRLILILIFIRKFFVQEFCVVLTCYNKKNISKRNL